MATLKRQVNKKSFKEFSNECKRKTKRRRTNNAEYSSPEDTKTSQEKGTRIGGSTTALLPEPRANQVSGIEIYNTPPTQNEDF